jgi:hypothetical protein
LMLHCRQWARSSEPWLNVIKLEGIKVFIERCRKADKVVLS